MGVGGKRRVVLFLLLKGVVICLASSCFLVCSSFDACIQREYNQENSEVIESNCLKKFVYIPGVDDSAEELTE